MFTSEFTDDDADDDADDDERESLFTLAPVDHDEYGESLTFDHLKSISAKSSDSQKNKSSVDYSQFFMEYDHGTPSVISSTRCQNLDFTDLLKKAVKKIKSPTVFIKIAYPTMILPTDLCSFLQPMAKIDTKRDAKFLMFFVNFDLMCFSSRDLLSKEMAYLQEQSTFNARVVYDLDSLVCSGDQLPESLKVLDNDDHNRVGIMVSEDHLLFESRFEGANLRRAIQISKWHYQLILSPDINQIKPHYQWFYFEVSNNEAHVDYMFEIVNCFKKISMFNNGMQPVLFSVTEACRGNPGWIRSGSEICYCRNTFVNSFAEKGKDPTVPKNYFSLRFTIKFIHRADVCYIAYHFPYTYSMLRATLEWYLAKINEKRLYIRYDELCTSLAGNSVFLVTVTASGSKEQLANRELILISARVHPGENNSSWIMHGIMNFLVSDKREAVELRDQFVFKLIPMLNVDGVVNGSHRCSLAGIDLNRTWNQPSPVLHPPIYHSKAIVEYMVNVLQKKPFLYVDLHGHSKRFNVFLYGNNPEESWCIEDHSLPGKSDFMSLPRLLKNVACRFNITKTKESSSRVALWREYGITRSYTMESTYCGFDAGPLKGYQINILHMLEMGAILCEACRHLQHHMPVQDDEESE
ncbi:unnamed protein product [Thelazia callipaeda]|uniref:Peptidase M14 domain-containing protein n=1 Tax=Thelazia callipaeda TaxID=103827 RepID=A0A3P7NB05_THECL|nr:unnamed protein product [Thelazia callipaeda]